MVRRYRPATESSKRKRDIRKEKEKEMKKSCEKEAEPDESTRAGFSKLQVLVGWVTQRKNGGHKIRLFYKKLYFPTV